MRTFAKSLMSYYVVLLILFFCFFPTYTKFWFLYHLFSLFTNFFHLQLSLFTFISVFSSIIFEIFLRFFRSLAFDFLTICFVLSILFYFYIFLSFWKSVVTKTHQANIFLGSLFCLLTIIFFDFTCNHRY